jgi:hypothetical protein
MKTKLGKGKSVIKPDVRNKDIQMDEPTIPTKQPKHPKASNKYEGRQLTNTDHLTRHQTHASSRS